MNKTILAVTLSASNTGMKNPLHTYKEYFDGLKKDYSRELVSNEDVENAIKKAKERDLSSVNFKEYTVSEIEDLNKRNELRNLDLYVWKKDGKLVETFPHIRPDVGWWITRKIKDYTVKLSYTPKGGYGSSGTGWFFDFELPKDNKYPTRWYLATNQHVVSDFVFDKDPYRQAYFSKKECHWWLFFKECNSISDLSIYRDWEEYGEMPSDRDPESLWGSGKDKKFVSERVKRSNNRRNRILSAGGNVDSRTGFHTIVKTVVRDPRVFLAPKNYMYSKKTSFVRDSKKFIDYVLDLVILEIDFDNELIARRMTNNIYDKYYKSDSPGKPLNFFSRVGEEFILPSSLPTQRIKQFFSVAYPYNGNADFRAFWNYSAKSMRASVPEHFLESEIHYDAQPVFKSGALDVYQRGKSGKGSRDKWAYMYCLGNMPFSKGASGSMVTDVYGNVLGLYTMGNSKTKNGCLEPLRNSRVKNSKGEYVSMGFDMLEGRRAYQTQAYSYQVLIHDKNTYLRRVRRWNRENKGMPWRLIDSMKALSRLRSRM